jgi:hypothetical protein
MKFKFGFALLTFSIALFASGRFERFISQSQSYGNVWAQDAGDADQGQDVSSEPAVKPPDLQGMWSGPIDDAQFGSATITLDIRQKGSKLKGDWMTTSGGGGTFIGKVKSDGTSLSFKFKQKRGKCKVTSEGTLASATEIQGTYTSKKCGGASTGTFDLTLQPAM